MFINPLPRKGTETMKRVQQKKSKEQVHQSTTPQGDGNIESPTVNPVSNLFINPLPHKGTETKSVKSISKVSQKTFINPLPRKGTETIAPPLC